MCVIVAPGDGPRVRVWVVLPQKREGSADDDDDAAVAKAQSFSHELCQFLESISCPPGSAAGASWRLSGVHSSRVRQHIASADARVQMQPCQAGKWKSALWPVSK